MLPSAKKAIFLAVSFGLFGTLFAAMVQPQSVSANFGSDGAFSLESQLASVGDNAKDSNDQKPAANMYQFIKWVDIEFIEPLIVWAQTSPVDEELSEQM